MPRRETLPNGMTLIVDEMRVSPIVALARWVRSGSAYEPEEHSGVHHFLEHLLLKDTGEGSGLAEVVQDAGGYMNARTGLDHTAFYQVVPSGAWRPVLESVDRMLGTAEFTDADVDTERQVIIDEGNIAERDPLTFVWRRLMEIAFPESGYGRPIVGSPGSLANIDAGVLSDYLARSYVPSNMVQVVVGDVDAEEVIAAAVGLAAGAATDERETTRGDADARRLTGPPEWFSARHVYARDVQQSYLALAYNSPPAMHADTPALDVLCGLLGVGRSSRLRKSLHTSLRLVSDVAAATVGHRDAGLVVVRATGVEGAEPARILEEVLRQVRLLKDEPIGIVEASKSVRRVEAGYALEHETVESVAMTLGFFAAMGDHRYAEDYVDRLAAVTPADLARVARTYLRAEDAAVASLVPEDMASKPHGGGAPDVEALTAAIERGDAPSGASFGVAETTAWGPATTFSRPAIIRESPGSTFSRAGIEGGATLLVETIPGAPLVSVGLGFRGGFIDERDEELGLTSLTLEHMLRGTLTRSAERLADDIEGLGSGISASVDRDGFGVGLTVLAGHFEDALAVLGDAVCEPALLRATFEGVRSEALAELGAAEDHPLRRTLRRLRPLLFPAHRYGRPIGGTRESLLAAEPGATASWHARHFLSDRLIVCMVGGITPERAERAAVGALGGLGASGDPESVVPLPPLPAGRVEERLERAGQSSVAVGFAGPPVGTQDAAALHVAASAMTMMSGRLWRSLRERPPHAYSVRLTPTPMRAGGALIGHVTTPPGQEEAAVAAFVSELDALAHDGLTQTELYRGRRHLAGLIEISMQRGTARAAAYAVAEVAGVGYERVTGLPDIIRRVSNDDVIRAAQRYVSAEDEPAVVVLRG